MKEPFHKYNHTDIRLNEHGEIQYPFVFIEDVAGDNSDLFVLEEEQVDNQWIARKLQDLGAVTEGVKLEPCAVFYAYFTSQHAGTMFLKKLTAWLSQKAHLLDKARAY